VSLFALIYFHFILSTSFHERSTNSGQRHEEVQEQHLLVNP
jgi:hypothetical protein